MDASYVDDTVEFVQTYVVIEDNVYVVIECMVVAHPHWLAGGVRECMLHPMSIVVNDPHYLLSNAQFCIGS
jgi:hypothetical protein